MKQNKIISGLFISIILISLVCPVDALLSEVYGRIVDSDGKAVSGVTVSIVSNTTTTDASGDYNITGFTNASYTWETLKVSYQDKSGSVIVLGAVENNVTIHSGISWKSTKNDVVGAMNLFIAFAEKIPAIIAVMFIVIIMIGIALAIKKFAGNTGNILEDTLKK